MEKISIIIPVYNGGKYLSQTLDSILSQTYKYFEVICVNDDSSDDSLQILQSYRQKDSRIKIFTKPNGGTAPKAVKYGLQYAGGDYFMYMSQDDLLPMYSLQRTISRATETGAEVVLPDMQRYYENSTESSSIIGLNGDRSIVLTGERAFYYSIDWTIHGFALISMSLLKRVGYYDFSFNSDEYTTRLCYLNANKVVFSDGVFLYRCDNLNAITKKISPQIFDAYETYANLEHIARQFQLGEDIITKIRLSAWHIIVSRQIMLYQPSILTEKQKHTYQTLIRKQYISFLNQGAIRYPGLKGFFHNILMNHGFWLFGIYCHLLKMCGNKN